MKCDQHKGFTLIEVTIVVSMLAAISGFTFEAMSHARRQALIEGEREKIEQRVRQAQNQAIVGDAGLGWGVRCAGATLTVYSYDSTGAEVSTETTQIQSPVGCTTPSGDIRFIKVTGEPEAQPAEVLIQVNTSNAYRISISTVGTIHNQPT